MSGTDRQEARPASIHDRVPRERGERRRYGIGLILSAAVHFAIFWLAGSLSVDSLPFALPPVETVPAPEGLVVVEVAPSLPPETFVEPRPEPRPPAPRPERQEPEPEEPEPRPEEDEEEEEGDPVPAAPGEVSPPGAPAGPEEGERVTNASRLRLRYSDSRLWFDPKHPLLFGERLARFARADSAVRAILRDWLDSLRLDAEVEARARDWTFERDGKRWGISSEGIHLGDITIPIPVGFAPSGPQRRAFEQAIRDLTEIQLQDLRQDIEAVEDERREAMRRRSEEEIRRRSGDTVRVRGPPG